MRIVISENQLNKFVEIFTNDEIICDKCGWYWKLSEGGDDPYVCHKCGHNNFEDKK